MFSTLDHTQTSFGRRMLAGWVRQPLLSPEDIGARQVGMRVAGRAVLQAAGNAFFCFPYGLGKLLYALPVPCDYTVRALVFGEFWVQLFSRRESVGEFHRSDSVCILVSLLLRFV